MQKDWKPLPDSLKREDPEPENPTVTKFRRRVPHKLHVMAHHASVWGPDFVAFPANWTNSILGRTPINKPSLVLPLSMYTIRNMENSVDTLQMPAHTYNKGVQHVDSSENHICLSLEEASKGN